MEHPFFNYGIRHRRQLIWHYWMFLLIVVLQAVVILADTVNNEAAALSNVASKWQNPPQNWKDLDPCDSKWVGINCTNSHVTMIILPSMGLDGTLSDDIQNLPELWALDLSFNPDLGGPLPAAIGNLRKLKNLLLLGCSFSGQIPPELGRLQRLTILALNSNKFSGSIPGSLGNLTSLSWLDVTHNELSGTLPTSDGTNPGLDLLTRTKHFHFGNNKFNGTIPPELFHSDMQLNHLIMDNNYFYGSIPSTLGLVTTLTALRLDRNSLTGPVPSNLNNLTSISELYLSHNQLSGPLPNLTGMNALTYVDLSNNSFDQSEVPSWFSSTFTNLTTLLLERTSVRGQIPPALFNLPQLQTLLLKNNDFNGTVEIDAVYPSHLQLVDLRINNIAKVINDKGYSHDLLLADNPVCYSGGGTNEKYCGVPNPHPLQYSTPQSCVGITCPSEQDLSPYCNCSYPFKGTLTFRLLTVSDFRNLTYFSSLEDSLHDLFESYPVESLSIHDPSIDGSDYLEINVNIFPARKSRFNQADISEMAHLLSNQTLKSYGYLVLYYFIPQPYIPFQATSSSRLKNTAAIIGASVGGAVLLLVLTSLLIFVARRNTKAKKLMELSNPFGSWDASKSSGSVPQLKGARCFSFEELKKCTNDFSEANTIGSGGYGKVYRGALPDGQLVAVKRAQEDSMQGGLEFKTEIELLTRVHHKNLVNLVGFCFEHGEQMLIYEFLPNGTLKESLLGTSGIRLDWKRRLRVALDAARGLTYLHDLASPPIIHRDIKSTNILLDHNLNAKVADFGLCKPLGDDKKGHVTTQVKGTLGYLDPEYYMTQQLTEKSDVYSYGVLLLELITARKPIDKGKYIVREVKAAVDTKKDLYGLHRLVDPAIASDTSLVGFKRFLELALWCVEESGANRPMMSEVTKEIESIMQLAGMNPNVDHPSTSTSYEDSSTARSDLYSNENLWNYSGHIPSSKFVRT